MGVRQRVGGLPAQAVATGAARLAAGHHDALARLPRRRDMLADTLDDTGGLVAGSDLRERRRQRAVDQMDVRQADAARLHSHQYLPWSGLGDWNVLDRQLLG